MITPEEFKTNIRNCSDSDLSGKLDLMSKMMTAYSTMKERDIITIQTLLNEASHSEFYVRDRKYACVTCRYEMKPASLSPAKVGTSNITNPITEI